MFYKFIEIFTITLISTYLLFGVAETFTVASSIFAIEVYKSGHVPSITSFSSQKYWGDAIEFENQYPIPSLLLLTLYMVTGISLNDLPYLPLLIAFYIVFWLLANFISSSNYCSSLYSSFSMFYLLTLLYVNRVSLGIMIATSILYLLLKSFRWKDRRNIVVLALLSIILSLTYYTTAFMLIFLCFILLISNLIIGLKFRNRSSHSILNLNIESNLILVIFLTLVTFFMFNQFIYMYTYSKKVSLGLWLQCMYLSIKQALNLETKSIYIAPTNYSYDYLTYILKKVFQIIQIFSIISIPIVILLYLMTKIKGTSSLKISSYALFAISIILLYIGEFIFYTLTGNTIWSTRYLVLYGSLIFLGLVDLLISKLKFSKKAIIYFVFGVIILAGCYGNFRDRAYYFWDPTLRTYSDSFANFSMVGNTSIIFYSDPLTASAVTYKAEIYGLKVSSIEWAERIMNSLLKNDLESLKGKNLILFLSHAPLVPEAAAPLSTKSEFCISEDILASSNIIYNCGRLYAVTFI